MTELTEKLVSMIVHFSQGYSLCRKSEEDLDTLRTSCGTGEGTVIWVLTQVKGILVLPPCQLGDGDPHLMGLLRTNVPHSQRVDGSYS